MFPHPPRVHTSGSSTSLLPCLKHPFGLFWLPCQLLIQETSHSFVQPKDSPFWFLSSSLELNIRTVPPPFPRHSRGLGPSELLAKPVRSRPVLGRWSVFLGFKQPNTLVNDEWVAKEVGPSRMVVRLRWNLLKGHQFANAFFHFIHGNTHEIQIFFHLIIEHLRSSKNPTPKLLRTNAQPIQFVVTICWWRELWLRLPFLPPPSLIYILWEGHAQPRGDANCNFVCRFYLLNRSFTSSERDTLTPRGLGPSELLAKPVRSRPVLGRWSVFLGFKQPNTLFNDEWVAKEVGPSRMVVRLRWNLLKGHQFANAFFSFHPWKHSWKSNILSSHHWAPQKFKKPNPKTASNERPTHTICGDYLLVTRTVTSFAVSTSSFTHLHPLRGTRSAPAGSVPLSASTTPKAIDPNDLQLVFFSTRAAPAGKAIEIRTVLWPSPEEGYLTEIDR